MKTVQEARRMQYMLLKPERTKPHKFNTIVAVNNKGSTGRTPYFQTQVLHPSITYHQLKIFATAREIYCAHRVYWRREKPTRYVEYSVTVVVVIAVISHY